MLSIGACLVDDTRLWFYRELQPTSASAVKKALDVVGKPLEYFATAGVPPEVVMAELELWVKEVAKQARPIFVGFNAAFDWAFVNYYFLHYLKRNPFGICGFREVCPVISGYSGHFGRRAPVVSYFEVAGTIRRAA